MDDGTPLGHESASLLSQHHMYVVGRWPCGDRERGIRNELRVGAGRLLEWKRSFDQSILNRKAKIHPKCDTHSLLYKHQTLWCGAVVERQRGRRVPHADRFGSRPYVSVSNTSGHAPTN